jgi:hypothetical protein
LTPEAVVGERGPDRRSVAFASADSLRSRRFCPSTRGRRGRRQDALLNTESFDYDGNSNVVKFTDRKGQLTIYRYDAEPPDVHRVRHDGLGRLGPTRARSPTPTTPATA